MDHQHVSVLKNYVMLGKSERIAESRKMTKERHEGMTVKMSRC
ncbi:MAG: hypothetical protein ACP5TZ_00280 [Nitrososphaeria archaeon]